MFLLLLKELRHRWVIHVLTVFLIAFLSAILIIQSSINTSAEDKISKLSHQLGRSMLVVPEGTDLEQFYLMEYGNEFMPEDYPGRVKASPMGKHVELLEPRLYGNVDVQGHALIIMGRNMKFPIVSTIQEDFVAIGSGVAQSMGFKAGDTFEVDGHKLRVYSIIEPPPKGFDMAIFMSLKTAQDILDKPGSINALHMGGCWCELDVAAFASNVEKILPGTMAITVDGMAKSQIEIGQVMERYSLVFWIIGAILVTGSLVFLILYTIHKGGREIGLLLSIGLSPMRIIVRNIIISVLTAVSGAIIGYLMSVPLMSYGGMLFMRVRLSPLPGLLPWFAAASLAVAFIAVSFPSWYVTRLDPTKLLREE